MRLYRGDSEATKPALVAGTWLAADRDVAEFYSDTVHGYDVDGELLDLRRLGVDGDRAALAEELADAGISYDLSVVRWEELYQLVERPDFIAAAAAAGYDAVSCRQWHADYSDDAYDAVMICR